MNSARSGAPWSLPSRAPGARTGLPCAPARAEELKKIVRNSLAETDLDEILRELSR